ncbi:unnamed protein product [Alternaria burnsii]|nr:unnamed protein product [Alternaria burnsii]
MGFLSILPANLAVVETWITRIFLFLGLVAIGPWAALLVYDLLLYCCRAGAYEIPFIGGRARGKARPRAPSLTERPSGHRRKFSIASRDARHRRITEEKTAHSAGSLGVSLDKNGKLRGTITIVQVVQALKDPLRPCYDRPRCVVDVRGSVWLRE